MALTISTAQANDQQIHAARAASQRKRQRTDSQVRLESNKLADLLIAAEAIDALIRKHGIGDDDRESEPAVLALRAAIQKARG